LSWIETLRTGIGAIVSHRLRSALTMLGVLIGIAAVMLTVGLGEGAQARVTSEVASLGSNLLVVSPGSTTTLAGIRGGLGSASTLTMSDAIALDSKLNAPDIAAVAPTNQSAAVLTTAAGVTWTTTVVGSTPSWLSVRNRTTTEGSFFTQADETSGAAVVVLAPTTAQELFGASDPVGQTVSISGVPLTVEGVLDPVGSSSTTDEDDQAIVPMTTYDNLLFGSSGGTVSSILLQGSSSATLSAAYQEADDTLLALHGITTPADADFTITTQQSVISAASSVDKTLTVLLAGIAAISLLVGGIGVMNIMLVSVTERVREIGLRKALGATPHLIRRQFMVEASILGMVGGILGVALGILGAILLPYVISDPIAISPTAAAGAVLVAILIGLGFGVYPASRAARLAPIDALRSE
jgi:putative ABC transport system permease protein